MYIRTFIYLIIYYIPIAKYGVQSGVRFFKSPPPKFSKKKPGANKSYKYIHLKTFCVSFFRTQDDDDPFIKGEFDVIKELLEKIPEAKDGKQKVIINIKFYENQLINF